MLAANAGVPLAAQDPATSGARAPADAAVSAPALTYSLTHDPADSCWRVHLEATGLDPAAGAMSLELADWGEWTAVEGYLREWSARPDVHPDPAAAPPAAAHRWLLEAPPDWDGTLEVSYAVPLAPFGTDAQHAHGLLPTSDGSTARGFSSNTLIDVLQGGRPLDAPRTIHFVAGDLAVATGWGGTYGHEQTVRLSHPIDNAPLFFGSVRTDEAFVEGGLRIEVAQLGEGARPATSAVLEVMHTLVPLYSRNCGRPPADGTVRVFITPWDGGGTMTDHGLVTAAAQWNEDAAPPADGALTAADLSPQYIRLLAHEVFHLWLGGLLRPPDDESLVWFHEGFTEYFADWHVAASGLASREWFAERIATLDARARGSAAYGRVAFGDPSVAWRDGDGPNETLGYSGGALLAFHADVELRRQGRPGLLQLIADLMQQDDRRLERGKIRAWMEANGLKEFYERSIAQPARFPDVDATLASLGFELGESEASLTYLGIQVEGDAARGRVVAVDESGPAAASVKVGDAIVGWSPARVRPPRVGQAVATKFKFGLTCIASGAEFAELDMRRDGRELKVEVKPRLIEGGVRTDYRTSGDKLNEFFRFMPP